MHCTMKTFIYSLLTIATLGLTSCNQGKQTEQTMNNENSALSAVEEMRLAFNTFGQARKAEAEGQKEKSKEI